MSAEILNLGVGGVANSGLFCNISICTFGQKLTLCDPGLLVVSKGVCVCTTSPLKIDTPEIWPSFKERGTSIYRGTGFLVTIPSFEVERLQKRLDADRTRRANGVPVENVARGPKGDCKGRSKWWEMTFCIG